MAKVEKNKQSTNRSEEQKKRRTEEDMNIGIEEKKVSAGQMWQIKAGHNRPEQKQCITADKQQWKGKYHKKEHQSRENLGGGM